MGGNHIILDYIRVHNISGAEALLDTYCRLKFKAYLQETLRCTKKAYCSKLAHEAQQFQLAMQSDVVIDEAAHSDTLEGILLEQALRSINKAQYDVLRLYFFYDKTESEISHRRQVSRQAVNNLKRRGLLRLKELMRDV